MIQVADPPFFSAERIEQLVTTADLLDPITHAMIAVSNGEALHPPRFAAPVNEAGRMGLMYGGLTDPPIHGVKVISLYPGAAAMGLTSHQGLFLLFSSTDGRPMAVMDADMLTALRTAAMSIVATRALARPDPRIITVCGAGHQAERHARASLRHFPDARVRIWARRPERAVAMRDRLTDAGPVEAVEDLAHAISGADVVHTTTSSRLPFLPGALLEPGQHVNLVGASLADSREVDDEAVARSSMFTDSIESAGREAGEILGAASAGVIAKDHPLVEIGQVLAGGHPGRSSAQQITAYKSHGLIVQDLAAGMTVVDRAG